MMTKRAPVPESWTVARLLTWTENYFREQSIPSPRLDAELLLAEALGCTRLELYTDYQKLVEPQERGRYRELVGRRAGREPVAYILGRREFYSLTFEVSPHVLVPRPETEHLVEFALEHTKRSVGGPILDLGTGSGNIAISVVVTGVEVSAVAVDVSAEALAVARRNAAAHGVADRIRFVAGDMGSLPLPDRGLYDLILSNPPYVSAVEYEHLMAEVRSYEPRGALVDNKSPDGDGLGYYREIAWSARRWLKAEGVLAVEIGDGQAAPVREILESSGWRVTDVIKDYSGTERVVAAEPSR